MTERATDITCVDTGDICSGQTSQLFVRAYRDCDMQLDRVLRNDKIDRALTRADELTRRLDVLIASMVAGLEGIESSNRKRWRGCRRESIARRTGMIEMTREQFIDAFVATDILMNGPQSTDLDIQRNHRRFVVQLAGAAWDMGVRDPSMSEINREQSKELERWMKAELARVRMCLFLERKRGIAAQAKLTLLKFAIWLISTIRFVVSFGGDPHD